MRIAILSDIHANDFALKATLDQIQTQDIDQIYVLGDIVGYYYEPKKVLELLEYHNATLILGNHELILKHAYEEMQLRGTLKSDYGTGIKCALDQLSEIQIEYLIDLPMKVEFEVDSKRILLCHATPWDIETYIYPDAEKELLDKCLDYQKDYVFLGHSHYPMNVIHEGIHLLNPGSVGQSRDIGGLSSWMIFDTLSGNIDSIRTEYNINALVDKVMVMDPDNSYLHQVLTRKRAEGYK